MHKIKYVCERTTTVKQEIKKIQHNQRFKKKEKKNTPTEKGLSGNLGFTQKKCGCVLTLYLNLK